MGERDGWEINRAAAQGREALTPSDLLADISEQVVIGQGKVVHLFSQLQGPLGSKKGKEHFNNQPNGHWSLLLEALPCQGEAWLLPGPAERAKDGGISRGQNLHFFKLGSPESQLLPGSL